MKARRWLAIVAVVGASACVPPPPGPGPLCRLGWGAQEQTDGAHSLSPIVNVRAGVHECFDRLVVDIAGTVVPGYAVRYVDTLTGIASDEPIPLRGGALVEVVVRAPASDVDTGTSTYPKAGQAELVDLAGFPTFQQVTWAGEQEGLTKFGVGVRARLPFRVFTLQGPGERARLVVDVAHAWS